MEYIVGAEDGDDTEQPVQTDQVIRNTDMVDQENPAEKQTCTWFKYG